jgi:hypothetical protein
MKYLLVILGALLGAVPLHAAEMPHGAALDHFACHNDAGIGPLHNIAYCGRFSTGGGGGGGGSADSQPCSFYVASSGGSNSNAGTSAAPFATLGKLQTVLRGAPSLSKVGCLKAGSGGTYHLTSTLTFSTADNGEIWQFDPASGVNTAIIDGGGSVDAVNLNGVGSFKWNGIAITNVLGHVFYGGGGDNFTLENSELSFNHGSGACGDGFPPMTCIGPGKNWKIANNYVHDTLSQGIGLFAFNSTDSIDGAVITGNVVIRACQTIADCGAIYTNMRSSGINGGQVTISNNFVRDWGSSALSGTGGVRGIYLDDNSSNETVTGNIVGPPTRGALNSGNDNNSGAFIVNGGTNNTYTGNLVDLGDSGLIAVWGGGGNSGSPAPGMPSANVTDFEHNIILFNFAGSLNDSWSGVTGFAYYQAGPASSYTIKNNAYTQYASGGSVFSNGQVKNDTNPTVVPSASAGISGYLYSIAAGAPATKTPVLFPGDTAAAAAGPFSFVIPTSANHSSP